MKSFVFAISSIIAGMSFATAEEGRGLRLGPVTVERDRALTEKVLDFQEGLTSDVPYLLKRYEAGELKTNSIYVGGLIRGGLYKEQTNTAGKFPILSRFPFQHDSDTDNTEALIQNAAVTFTGNFGKWVTAFAQIEHSEVFYRPDQDNVQLREAYVIFGNLEQSPFYAAVGRKTVDFGQFDTFTPFTHSVNQHYFWTLSDDPVVEVGYIGDTFRISGTLINGSRQMRVAYSDNDDVFGNFAVKAEKVFTLDRIGARARLSASYLHDTIYNNNFTAHTEEAIIRAGPPNAPAFPPVFFQERNGLMNVAALLNFENIDVEAEYTRSTDKWPATTMSALTGESYDDSPVLQAITLQGRYNFDLMGKDANFSAVLSRGIFGPDDTEFDLADQHSAALEWSVLPFLNLGAEYVYNNGFQPFVGIQEASDTGVESHTFIIGGDARF
ncbi:DUF3573 domain-containing protein [Parvularcula marina]|uniref:DUF3573 domain-containing protein n=1 Tax=Parvularcula marina TaxID=2292771 RepID=UPI00351993E7